MPASTASELSQIIAGQRLQTPSPLKKGKGLRLLLVGVIVVLIAAGVFRMVAKPAAPVDRVLVVAAGKDLPAGYRIGFTSLRMVDIPVKYLTPTMSKSTNELVGRVTRTFVPMGEPLTADYLLPTKKGLADIVNFSERALTLNLGDDGLVDHSIYPGDVVDVIATTSGPKDGRKYTKTICQNVTVLMAVPKESLLSDKISGNEAKNKITLSVLPADAEKISQASESGKIRLVLRNAKNRVRVQLTGADDRDLLPHSALRQEAPEILQAPGPAQPLPLPALAPANVFAPASESSFTPPQQPLQWVVDVFKGATKEAQAVDAH